MSVARQLLTNEVQSWKVLELLQEEYKNVGAEEQHGGLWMNP